MRGTVNQTSTSVNRGDRGRINSVNTSYRSAIIGDNATIFNEGVVTTTHK